MRHARSKLGRTGCALFGSVALALAAAASLEAQEPPPAEPPTERPDTLVVPIPPEHVAQDTLPNAAESAPDTLRPAPRLPDYPRPPARGWSDSSWEWDQVELARYHGLSLLALLETVPGLLVTRGGDYGRAAGLAAFGLGGGRVRVFLDGFELDPLATATLDLQQIPIVDLRAVRVQRGLAETRIELSTFQLADRRPFSEIEAATGVFNTRLLRGLFSTTLGERSVLTVGLDLADTDGWLRQHPYSANSGLARISYALGSATAIQVEYRQTSVDRARDDFDLAADRRDLILRARSVPYPGLTLDASLGRSSRRPESGDSLALPLASRQAALRARYDAGALWLAGAARGRDDARTGYVAPRFELTAEAGLRPLPWLSGSALVRTAQTAGRSGTEFSGEARLGPFLGLSLFAGGASGTRVLGTIADSIVEIVTPVPIPVGGVIVEEDTTFAFPVVAAQLRAFRAGAEWSAWGVRLGTALIRHDVDSIVPYGMAFDLRAPPVATLPANGFEGYFSIPLIYRPLRFEGAYTRWQDTGDRPYLPVEDLRLALVFNERFYGGNLEPTLRVESLRRGSALVPDPQGTAFSVWSEPYHLLNVHLQVRVLDVRAFLVWENLLHRVTAADIPGRPFGGQRAIYGVRWHFFD